VESGRLKRLSNALATPDERLHNAEVFDTPNYDAEAWSANA
jgi:hypothetical protein